MDHDVVTGHGAFERGHIVDVGTEHPQPAVLLVLGVMPLAAGGKIVVERHRFHTWFSQQPVREMAADEAGAPGDEEPGAGHFTDSHLVALRCSSGWLTKRCQRTAQSPSVCGVTRSAAMTGTRMQNPAASRVNPPSRPTMPKM